MTELAPMPETGGYAPSQRSTTTPTKRRAKAVAAAGATVLLLAGTVGWGALLHATLSNDAEVAMRTIRDVVPNVRTMAVKAVAGTDSFELPGSMQAFDSATLYARATGYIASRAVDIGSRVRAGDTLAVIAAPDLDQQLAQARAQYVQLQASLSQSEANNALAKVTSQRTATLVAQGWSSRQKGDTDRLTFEAQTASVDVAKGNLLAQQAQVNRLVELTGFERITAPFDGVITARQIDVGSLVSADASAGTSLYAIARTDVLRVQVYVPQEHVFGIRDGQAARVTVPQLPGQVFPGRVARNARSLSRDTRTLLVEVDVDNAAGTLAAGLYGVVRFDIPRNGTVVTIPSEAVIFDRNGLSATVANDGVLHIRHLELLSDDGAQLTVSKGLEPGDLLVLNPPIGARDGMRVHGEQNTDPIAALRRPIP